MSEYFNIFAALLAELVEAVSEIDDDAAALAYLNGRRRSEWDLILEVGNELVAEEYRRRSAETSAAMIARQVIVDILKSTKERTAEGYGRKLQQETGREASPLYLVAEQAAVRLQAQSIAHPEGRYWSAEEITYIFDREAATP
jgi:hypothetical protein